MAPLMTRFAASEDGQTSVEYAVVLLLVAVALVFALNFGIGGELDDFYDKFSSALP